MLTESRTPVSAAVAERPLLVWRRSSLPVTESSRWTTVPVKRVRLQKMRVIVLLSDIHLEQPVESQSPLWRSFPLTWRMFRPGAPVRGPPCQCRRACEHLHAVGRLTNEDQCIVQSTPVTKSKVQSAVPVYSCASVSR